LRRARPTLALFFLADGFVLASWASRVPAVKSAHGLSDARLGVVLFGIASGALLSMPATAWLVQRAGSRRAVLAATVLNLVPVAVIASVSGYGALVGMAVLFGCGFGAMNVALNAHAIALERQAGRPILSGLHASFSFGGLAGAGVGALAAGAGVAAGTHLGVAAGVLAALLALAAPGLALPPQEHGPEPAPLARPRRALLALGAIAFCCLMAEGAAADWSAVFLRDTTGAGPGLAAIGYFAFSGAMASGRLAGDGLVLRFGARTLVRAGATLGAAGLTAALITQTPVTAVLGWAVLGAGLSTIVPITFRAAGRASPAAPSAGVAAVSSIGWLGFLSGPPVIGFVSTAASSLAIGLGLVVVAVTGIALLAARVEPRSAQTRLADACA
jgi:predicted MFS family arabinose efflux permease